MIGDREYDPDAEDDTGEDLGPMDSMVRLDSPVSGELCWVERYDRVVLVRTTLSADAPADQPGVVLEMCCPTQARAVREVAGRVAALVERGFRVVTD